MGELAVWWLAIEIVSLVALPLTALVCANLPGRGWPLAKPLGVLTLGWLIWFPLAVVSALPYSAGWIAGVFVVYAAGNAVLLWRMPHVRAALMRLLQRERAYLIASELVFAASFALMGWFRSFTPAVKDTEKFMDVAFVSALWRAQHLPAPDPWLSGYPINYYYFGHYLIATLAKALGTVPAVAFNCGIAMIFALTAVAVFGVGSALYAASRPAGSRLRRAIPVGIVSALLVLVLGNLAGFGQWWQQVQGLVASNPKELAGGPWAFWLHRDLWQTYFYWPPSRVVPGTINEFPAFSFVLSDLHAHILALPFAALAVGLALNLLLSRGEGLRAFGRGAAGWLALLAAAVCIGGLYAINGWDLPTYLGLALLALALQQWIVHGRAWSATFVLNTLAAGAVLSVACLLVYLPFYAGFVSPQQGFGLVPPDQRSPIGDEFQIYGLYAFILFSLLALWLGRRLAASFRVRSAEAAPGAVWWAIRGHEGETAALAVGLPLALLLLLTRASADAGIWTLLWCVVVIAVCVVLVRARLGGIATRQGPAGVWADESARGGSPSPRGPRGGAGVATTSAGAISGSPSSATRSGEARLASASATPSPRGARGPGSEDASARASLAPVDETAPLRARGVVPQTPPGWTETGLYAPGTAFAPNAAAAPPRMWSRERARRAELWVLVLVGTSAALVAVCELVFLRDIFGTRMNTVFKLYFQAWLLLGIAGGPALAWLFAAARRTLAAALPPAVTVSPGVAVERLAPANVADAADAVPGATLAFAGSERARAMAADDRGTGGTCPAPTSSDFSPRGWAWRPQLIVRSVRGLIRRPSWPGAAQSLPSATSLSASASSASSASSAVSSSPANGPAGLRRAAAGGILIWIAALVVLVAVALVFPVLAASNQTANFSLPHSLDGTAYMATDPTNVPADCANFVGAGSNAHDDEAIAWLNTHISGSPVLVEAPGCEWSHYSRISAFTGLPTLVGWPGGHEYEWRMGWLVRTGEYGIFDRRAAAVNQIYTDPDNSDVLALLRQYDVRLVYVGAAERNLYPKANLNRFRNFLRVIYDRDGVTIYQVPA